MSFIKTNHKRAKMFDGSYLVLVLYYYLCFLLFIINTHVHYCMITFNKGFNRYSNDRCNHVVLHRCSVDL